MNYDARKLSSEYRKRYQVFNLSSTESFVETFFILGGKLLQTFML